MRGHKKNICPFLGEPCIEERCKLWVHLVGEDPQTGAAVDKFDCSFQWFPRIMLEATRQTRHAAASIDSFRNEMVRRSPPVEFHRLNAKRIDAQP